MANAQVVPTQNNWNTGVSRGPGEAAALAQLPTGYYLVDTSGAIPLLAQTVIITKATAAVMTLAAPAAGVDDGKIIRIVSTTAAAHTVTNTSPGFNGAGGSGDVATFGATIGNNLQLLAYNGVWLILSQVGITVA